MVRIAFLGTPACAVPALRALASQRVAAVFCNPDRPAGRGRKFEPPPVKVAAEALGLPICQPKSWKDPSTRGLWESLRIDLAVVVAYGHLLPSWMFESCSLGAWNLHFSLLPRWRGASPVNHAILAGDEETGVSLMAVRRGLDAGPVLAQCRRPIRLEDDAEVLLARLAEDSADLLAHHLPDLLEGTANPWEQDPEALTLAPKLDRTMAVLDPSRPALELHRRVRALQPWPGVDLPVPDGGLKLLGVGRLRPARLAAGILAWDREGAWLGAGDAQDLELTLLQRPGKPVQSALQALQPRGPRGEMRIG